MTRTNRVGLIGLGLLGSAMMRRFRAAGLGVIGFDVSADACANAKEAGVDVKPSAVDVFAACETVVLSLPTSDVVERVLADLDLNTLASRTIIDTTTGDPDRMAALGAKLAARGIEYLDATIAASSAQVDAGDCVVMVGGTRGTFDACRPLFATFARGATLVGPCGDGARMKLVVNLMLGLSRAVMAEALTFAAKCGLDQRVALEVLRDSNAYSKVMDTKGERMLTGAFTPPQARLSQHLKDVRLMLEMGQRVGATLPLSEQHRALLEACESMGLGGVDNSAVIKAFETST